MKEFSPTSGRSGPSSCAEADRSREEIGSKGSGTAPTLCLPDPRKSCFACCPPIRPAGYEHIRHRSIVQRMLRENTLAFSRPESGILPIRGFSCWALGYLDRRCRLVGCLLHPARNGGVDFRYRVDYGEKCRREDCRESTVFLGLDMSERLRWLRLADGLEAFAYSSRACNPLFPMLGWGTNLLSRIAREEPPETFDREAFFRKFPVFSTRLNPWGHAYLMGKITRARGVGSLKREGFREDFEDFAEGLRHRLAETANPAPEGPFVHRLDVDRGFSDFLRLSVGLRRTNREHAEALRRLADRAIASLP
jgi:hypothetical protein